MLSWSLCMSSIVLTLLKPLGEPKPSSEAGWKWKRISGLSLRMFLTPSKSHLLARVRKTFPPATTTSGRTR